MEGGYELQLRFSGDLEGHRSIRAKSCDAMATTTAVLTAMMLDEPVVAPAPAPSAAASDEVGAVTSDAADAEPSMRPGFGVALVLDEGSLPRLTLGVALRGSLTFSALRLAVGVSLFPGTVDELDARGARVELSRFEFAFDACTNTVVAACGGFGVAALEGRSQRVQRPEQATDVVPSPHVGAAWRLALDRIARLRLEAGVGFPLRRSRWQVEDYAFTHRATPVVGRFGVGLELEP